MLSQMGAGVQEDVPRLQQLVQAALLHVLDGRRPQLEMRREKNRPEAGGTKASRGSTPLTPRAAPLQAQYRGERPYTR